MNTFQQALQKLYTPAQWYALTQVRVGVAGAGGLGSNATMLLARCGVTHFVVVDNDVVEIGNVNRQHYFPHHVGIHKVDALADMLMTLNPAITLTPHKLWLNTDNMPAIVPHAHIWIEALDGAVLKRAFVECVLAAHICVVSASGIGGYGGQPLQKRRLGKNLVLIGDYTSDCAQYPPLAPRVMQAAALQADAVLEYILGTQSCQSLRTA